MAKVLKSINGIDMSRQPTDFDIERFNLTKSGRLASGRMTMELIAKKRKFNFSYEVMSGVELEKLKTAIDSDTMIFDLVYEENNVEYTVSVYRGGLKYRKFRTDGVWYWKSVTFNLIEE